MKALRLLLGLAVFGASAFALAEPVNHCKGADGRTTLTDRPCGDPSTERAVGQPTLVVEQIQADDIFRARALVRQDGSALEPPATTPAGSDASVRSPGAR